MNPWAGRDINDLSADQRSARRQWMIDEANRLIEARHKIQRPANAVHVNSLPVPAAFDGAAANDRQVAEIAGTLVSRLARKDAW